MMLQIYRRTGQCVRLAGGIVVRVLDVDHAGRVKLGFELPDGLRITLDGSDAGPSPSQVVVDSLAERVYRQSELLSRRAEGPVQYLGCPAIGTDEQEGGME